MPTLPELLAPLGLSLRTPPEEIAKALEDGAARGDPELVSMAISAIDLAYECDLDEEEDHVLACAGRNLRADPAWVDALVEARDLETLERLAELQDAPASVGAALSRVVPVLVSALDGAERSLAAHVLHAIAERKLADAGVLATTVPKLIALLEHEDAQPAAIAALAAIGDARAVEPIVALLADPRVSDYTKAWHGAEAALRLGAVAAAPSLIALFDRTSDRVQRSHYVRALATLDPVRAAPAIARVWSPTDANAHVLHIAEAGALAGDARALAFLEAAARAMGHLRSNALTSLAKVKGAASFDELCKGATDESDLVRWSAVAALRELRDPRSFDALVASLRLVTHTAATALRELGDPRAIPHLVRALEKDHGYYQLDVMMKESLIEALGDFGHDTPEVWSVLVSRLRDRSDHVGECSAIALQQLRPGCAEGVELVVRKMDRIPNVPKLVERSTLPLLARLRDGSPRGEIVDAAKRLRAALDGPERVLRALDETIARWSPS